MNKYSNISVRTDDPNWYTLTRKGAKLIIEWNEKEIELAKIINGHRNEYEKTETELKALGLMPDAAPIGYGLQQFNGNIFYIYDIKNTKKFELTDNEKLQIKNYRKDLRTRKTCPICKKVQKYLYNLKYDYLLNGKNIYACTKCINAIQTKLEKKYAEEEEKIIQKRRQIKHDFTAYFVNKGIDITKSVDKNDRYEIVYLDFETTGLSSKYDEILQVSIIDDKGNVLLYKLCKPLKNNYWDEAMDIHGITPKDVENEEPFEYYINDISDILLRSKTIVCYNCSFEIGFLNKYNVKYYDNNCNRKFQDCMELFAEIYGEWNEYFQSYKWQKLSTAAKYYNFNYEGQEHNSLADVFATKFVYEKIVENKNFR